MKRILITLFLAFVSYGTFAQQAKIGEQNFRLGYGFFSFAWDEAEYTLTTDHSSPVPYNYTTSRTGTVGLTYLTHVSRVVSVGAQVSYMGLLRQFDDRYFYGEGHYNSTYISVIPTVSFTWYNKKDLRMYSYIAMGVTFRSDSVVYDNVDNLTTDAIFASQFAPFGIAYGKNFFCYAELAGLGMGGAIILGVGYRFDPK